MKHLYKFIALVFIFMIGIAFFSKSIPSISVSTTTASSIQDSTFPMVYLQEENRLSIHCTDTAANLTAAQFENPSHHWTPAKLLP